MHRFRLMITVLSLATLLVVVFQYNLVMRKHKSVFGDLIRSMLVSDAENEQYECEALVRSQGHPLLMQGIQDTYFTSLDELEKFNCRWHQRLHKYLLEIMTATEAPPVNAKDNQKEFYNAKELVPLYELNWDFLVHLKKYPQFSLFTYGLPHDIPEQQRILNKYYPHAGTMEFCQILQNPEKHPNMGFPKGQENGTTFNPLRTFFHRSCITEIDQSAGWVSHMSDKYFRITPDFDAVHKLKGSLVSMYLIKTVEAFVDSNGVVYSGKVKLHPAMCIRGTTVAKPVIPDGIPVYEEVLVVSQYYAKEVYHSIIENLSRLGPYLAMIERMPNLKIHAGDTPLVRHILDLLGVGSRRLITGFVRAKTLYLPEGTGCGFPRPLHVQLLAKALRKQILRRSGKLHLSPQKARKILLIKRSGERKFIRHHEIHARLSKTVQELGGSIRVFADKPLPSFNEMIKMFSEADVIVAPHGAGLTNIVFAKPGVVVVEGICRTPNMNLCYLMLSYLMGHQYYGIPSIDTHAARPGGGCPYLDVSVKEINEAARYFLSR